MLDRFETLFTQPILARLDAGTVGNAKDWADLITNSYIRTIQTGFPQGLPPALPAPGLNPIAPPPFPIGPGTFNTANASRKKMYNLVYAYYYAKEIAAGKVSLQGMINLIKRTQNTYKRRIRQVKSAAEQIKTLQAELEELPKMIPDILRELQKEVKAQLKDAEDIIKNLQVQQSKLDPQAFLNVFRKEIELYNKLKNFDISNLRAVTELSILLSEFGPRTDQTIAALDSQQSTKQYIIGKLVSIGKIFLQLAQGIFDPSKIVNYVRDLSIRYKRLETLRKKIDQFDLIKRYLEPKIKKLKLKKNAFLLELKGKLQNRLLELRKKYEERLADYLAKRKDTKQSNLYTKTSKVVNDLKKNVLKVLKMVRKKLKALIVLQRRVVALVGKVATIKVKLEREFEIIKQNIERYQKKLNNYKDQISELKLPKTKQQDSTNSDRSLQESIKQLNEYMSVKGMAAFGNPAALILVQLKCDFQTFVQFFERDSQIEKRIGGELNTITSDIAGIAKALNDLVQTENKDTTKTPEQSENKGTQETGAVDAISTSQQPKKSRIKSLSDAISTFLSKLEPAILAIKAKVKRYIRSAKDYIKRVVDKKLKDIETYAISIIPIKADVQDPLDRKQLAEAKARILKDKIAKIKDILARLANVKKIVSGLAGLYGNVSTGKYDLPSNRNFVDQCADGYYGYLSHNKPRSAVEGLQKEKAKFKRDFNRMSLIDTLIRALIQTFRDLQSGEFQRKFKTDTTSEYAKIKGSISQVNADVRNFFTTLLENPPKTPNEVIKFVQNLNVGVLESNIAIRTVLDIERKYLSRTRVAVDSILGVAGIDPAAKKSPPPPFLQVNTPVGQIILPTGVSADAKPTVQKSGVSYIPIAGALSDLKQPATPRDDFEKTLIWIHTQLKKNESFIMLLINTVKEQILRFGAFLKNRLAKFVKALKERLKREATKNAETEVRKQSVLREKLANADAAAMSAMLGLAARALWTGASWTGPTGTRFTSFSIGRFKLMKSRFTDGPSVMIREIAQNFNAQLLQMRGIAVPPANTGIGVLPFNGYT